MARKHTIEEIAGIFSDNNCVLISKEYVDNKTELDFICRCGNLATRTFNRFSKFPYCTDCGREESAKKRKPTIAKLDKELAEHGCVLISQEYKDNKTNLDFICSCGIPDSKTVSTFTKNI